MNQELCIAALVLGLQATGVAGETAIAVSPGGADQPTQIETHCPTFSWGSQAGVASYELVVFEVKEAVSSPLTAETLAETSPLAL